MSVELIASSGLTCLMCPTPLRARQKSFCSHRCHSADSPTLNETLALLEATRGTWMTISDIAIWIFGDDSEKQKLAARTVLWRLREHGHRFDTRPAPWEYRPGRGRGLARAYRLAERTLEAAA